MLIPALKTRLATATIRALRAGEKLVRLSHEASLYAAQDNDAARDNTTIEPVRHAALETRPRSTRAPVWPASLTFSGQLLELGLKHNVDGLVQRAPQQLSYDGAKPVSPESRAAARYEKAQGNFARDSLALFAREC